MITFLADLLISGTVVTLQPSGIPGALAEVVMDNQITNSPLDNGEYQLALDGLEVGIHFTWDKYQGDDAITIIPPDGVICDPADCVLQLPEGKSGMVVLYGWSGS